MSNTLTVVLRDEHGTRYAIDHACDRAEAFLPPEQLITLRIGFESITLSRRTLSKLIDAALLAAHSGASYPEDYKGLVGL